MFELQQSQKPVVSEDDPTSTSLRGALRVLAERHDPPPDRRQARVDQWIAHMTARIRDPMLNKRPDGSRDAGGEKKLRMIAWALADGDLYRRHLDDSFNALEWHCRHKKIGSRAALWYGIMRRIFSRAGLPWSDRPTSTAAKSSGQDLPATQGDPPCP